MEKAIHVNDVKQIAHAGACDRVYYGSEFCQNLIPHPADLERVLDAAETKGRGFTLVTPYVTDEGIRKLEELFNALSGRDKAEVVFNDWGVFSLLRSSYPAITPVLGRLLTKQQRDPLARDVIFNRQKPVRSRDKATGTARVFLPRRVPDAVARHFKSGIVNVPAFQEFLISNGVRRVEIDNPVWDMELRVDGKIGVSLHVPLGYITTTRLCGLLDLTYGPCRRECMKTGFTFKDKAWPVPIHIAGNAVFYETKIPSRKYLSGRSIDRLVVGPDIPTLKGSRP